MRNRKPNGQSVKAWARHLKNKGAVAMFSIRVRNPEKHLHSSRRNTDVPFSL